uniref:Uncharacterized protein n=1 Tax=Arundo donax TaxID=35708 RepID=A0A0A8YM11_ARUDO
MESILSCLIIYLNISTLFTPVVNHV